MGINSVLRSLQYNNTFALIIHPTFDESHALTFTQEICYGAPWRAKGKSWFQIEEHARAEQLSALEMHKSPAVKKEICEKEPGNYVAFRSEQSTNVPTIRTGI